MSVEKDIIVKDTRKAKESIKHSQHKDDGAKIVGVMTGVGGAAVGGVAAATGTATMTVATGAASVCGVPVGGWLGSLLLTHGAAAAMATVATTTFAFPVFLGIALSALGIVTGYTLLKNWQNNRDIKDFNTTVDIDTLGKKIAESVFYPAVYFLRTLRVKKSVIKENLAKEMIKDYGFDEEFARSFLEEATEMRLDTLKHKIATQKTEIVIDIGGKEKKTSDLNLKFLRKKAIALCNSAINQSCYKITGNKIAQANETIKYMQTYLFKGKNFSF